MERWIAPRRVQPADEQSQEELSARALPRCSGEKERELSENSPLRSSKPRMASCQTLFPPSAPTRDMTFLAFSEKKTEGSCSRHGRG
jgi:hypothetical protein